MSEEALAREAIFDLVYALHLPFIALVVAFDRVKSAVTVLQRNLLTNVAAGQGAACNRRFRSPHRPAVTIINPTSVADEGCLTANPRFCLRITARRKIILCNTFCKHGFVWAILFKPEGRAPSTGGPMKPLHHSADADLHDTDRSHGSPFRRPSARAAAPHDLAALAAISKTFKL